MDDDNTEEQTKKPFDNLELREVFCFGYCPKAESNCWANLVDQSVTRGWKNSDVAKIDRDLKANVDACYFFVCQGTFADLDSGYRWRAAFVNDHMLWKLELVDGRGAETLPEDAEGFFASAYFKKFSKRCGDKIDRAVQLYRDVAERHVCEGELMSADPVKLERIIDLAETKRAMDNLRDGKYELK